MSVDLADYTDVLRREVTQPGSTLFSDVDDEVFANYLSDSFWEVRLDGFLTYWTEFEQLIDPIDPDDGDITRDRIALIVLYAGIRIVRNRLLDTNTKFKAVAGPVEYEVENSASMLTEMLRQLEHTKERLLETNYQTGDVISIDAFSGRQFDPYGYGGYLYGFFGEFIGGP